MMLPGDHSLSRSSSVPAPDSPCSFVVTQSRDIGFSCDSSHTRPNELLRARELLRYYTPPSPPQAPQGTEPLVDLGDKPVLSPAPIGGHKDVMKSTDDPALRAFSHLLALKLDCERSMISL